MVLFPKMATIKNRDFKLQTANNLTINAPQSLYHRVPV